MSFSKGLLGTASFLAALAAATAAGAQTMKPEVKIGVLTDMSSVFSDAVGAGSVLAAEMAVEDFIAAEKPGFKIKVVSADHTSKADVASSIARRWFDEDGVDVLTDVAGASVTLAVSNIGAEKNKLVLATASGQNSLSSEDCKPTLLHWTYNTRAVAATTAKAVTEAGAKSWYFVTADYAGGRSLEEDATIGVKAAGGKVLGSSKHPFNNQDFSSQILTAQGSGARAIGFGSAGPDAINAVKQSNEYGLAGKVALVPLMPMVTDINSLGLEMTKGMYVTEPFYWDLNDQTRAWSQRFFKARNKMPTMVQAGLYSAVTHYLKAVKTAKTADTDAVLAAMRSTPVNDMFTKNAHIRADNIVLRDMYLFQVKAPSESKYPWDYYKFVRTVPGDEAFAPLSESKCPLVKQEGVKQEAAKK
ncbi:ABC transporter substrate-binding protein [Azospirillum sp. sgz302134]